jgi:poly(3-hydroxybutyrate) depolymerase
MLPVQLTSVTQSICLFIALPLACSSNNTQDGSSTVPESTHPSTGVHSSTSGGNATITKPLTSSGGATGGNTNTTIVSTQGRNDGGSDFGGTSSSIGGNTNTLGTTATGGVVGSGGFGGKAPSSGGTHSGGTTSNGSLTPVAGNSSVARSAGCGKTSTLTFGAVPGESGQNVGFGEGGYVKIQSSGQSRGFALRLPDNYDKNTPYWLVFGFHWNGGNSKEVDSGGSNGYNMAHFGLQKLSKNGAIFVAPDGLNAGWANSGGQDLKFVDDMVKLIEENYCVDTTHLFTNGFSYGGGMSYAIACARAKVFRGAAIYEGAQLSGCENGNDPIAFWQMAGTTDTTCTIGMATPMRDKFAKNNGCTIPATEPPRPKSISDAHICTDYTGCSSGHPLRWCVHPAGHGNAIVDGTSDLWNSCATAPKTCSDTCKCTWVPEDVWSFFKGL